MCQEPAAEKEHKASSYQSPNIYVQCWEFIIIHIYFTELEALGNKKIVRFHKW